MLDHPSFQFRSITGSNLRSQSDKLPENFISSLEGVFRLNTRVLSAVP